MMIDFLCPNCGKQLRVKADLAGRSGRCNGCSNRIRVPTPNADVFPEALGETTAQATYPKDRQVSHANTTARVSDLPDVTIQSSLAQVILPIIAGTSAIAFALFCQFGNDPELRPLSLPLLGAGIVIVAIGAIALYLRRPLLILNEQGLFYASTKKMILWTEIEEVYTFTDHERMSTLDRIGTKVLTQSNVPNSFIGIRFTNEARQRYGKLIPWGVNREICPDEDMVIFMGSFSLRDLRKIDILQAIQSRTRMAKPIAT